MCPGDALPPTLHPRAAELIRLLELAPHPEGGYFREVFRSPLEVRRQSRADQRAAMTTIYFLLAAGQHSRWHRVAGSDEVWHFYEGDPLLLHCLDDRLQRHRSWTLGPVGEASRPVQVVPAGAWQAARTLGAYTLVGATVAPGFEFADFALLGEHPADAALLRERHPALASLL